MVACLSCPVGSGAGWGIDHYSNEREREQTMSYTKEDLRSMASNLCGIDSDSEGVAAINKAIDYLTEQAEKMELNEREGK